jgi:DNA-binding GntR family transcriptional regulator
VTQNSKFSRGSKPNSKINLTREAYNDIRKMIFINEFRPGQKVPYRELAKRLGMSLTPVVQALKHMEFLGLLQHEPNRGFYIKPIVAEEISEVYELREMLEVNLIPKIVAQLNKDGASRLKLALDEYLDASRSGSLKMRLSKDMNFHMTLAEISSQSISIRVLRYLLDFLYLRFEKEQIFSRPQESSAVEHQKIYDCIMARNSREAGKAVRNHIRSVKDNVMEDLRNRLEDSEEIEI